MWLTFNWPQYRSPRAAQKSTVEAVASAVSTPAISKTIRIRQKADEWLRTLQTKRLSMLWCGAIRMLLNDPMAVAVVLIRIVLVARELACKARWTDTWPTILKPRHQSSKKRLSPISNNSNSRSTIRTHRTLNLSCYNKYKTWLRTVRSI